MAVKAANETNSEDDRGYIQDEIDQLVVEIDRVATTTKFNESYLLKGTNANGEVAELTYETVASAVEDANIDETTGIGSLDIARAAAATNVDQSGNDTDDKGSYKLDTVEIDGKKYGYIYEITADGTDGENFTKDIAIENAKNADTDYVFETEEEMLKAVTAALNETGDIKSVSVEGDKINVEAFADLNNALNLSLHVGADSTDDNKIDIDISMMSARGLGVNGLRVDGEDDTNATAAIDTIATAIQKVSTQRSALGAVQNRFEHTIKNLDNVVENTTAAESQIRDTDMATEMVIT